MATVYLFRRHMLMQSVVYFVYAILIAFCSLIKYPEKTDVYIHYAKWVNGSSVSDTAYFVSMFPGVSMLIVMAESALVYLYAYNHSKGSSDASEDYESSVAIGVNSYQWVDVGVAFPSMYIILLMFLTPDSSAGMYFLCGMVLHFYAVTGYTSNVIWKYFPGHSTFLLRYMLLSAGPAIITWVIMWVKIGFITRYNHGVPLFILLVSVWVLLMSAIHSVIHCLKLRFQESARVHRNYMYNAYFDVVLMCLKIPVATVYIAHVFKETGRDMYGWLLVGVAIPASWGTKYVMDMTTEQKKRVKEGVIHAESNIEMQGTSVLLMSRDEDD